MLPSPLITGPHTPEMLRFLQNAGPHNIMMLRGAWNSCAQAAMPIIHNIRSNPAAVTAIVTTAVEGSGIAGGTLGAQAIMAEIAAIFFTPQVGIAILIILIVIAVFWYLTKRDENMRRRAGQTAEADNIRRNFVAFMQHPTYGPLKAWDNKELPAGVSIA